MILTRRSIKPAGNILWLLGSAAAPLRALAETAAPATPGVSAGTILQTALGLLLVLALLFLAAYLLRKFTPGHGFGRTGPLRVVGGLMIGNRERIVLLEVGEVWIVVGVGPGQIRTLHTMAKGEIQPATSDEKPFGQWLKQMVERKNETR